MDPAYWFIRRVEESEITAQKLHGKSGNTAPAISERNKGKLLYRETYRMSIEKIQDDDNCVTCASDKRTKSK